MKQKITDNPIIFLRTAWMNDYEGVKIDDIPFGAGSYVEENEDGGEVYNFKRIRGFYYGFARVQKGKNIDLSNLGLPKNSNEINNIFVVFFATNPITKSQFIVGWYKNATLYKNSKNQKVNNRGHWSNYLTMCKISDGHLVKPEDRFFQIEGPGQTNIWYPHKYKTATELKTIYNYINNPKGYKPKPKRKKGGSGWQIDAELRKKIEVAGMDAVAEYFEQRGFKINDVHKENKGWDLEAVKGKEKLLLEVKATQNEFNEIELTPNEYQQMNLKRNNFQLCIVSNALDKKQKTDIFFFNGQEWANSRFQKLKFKEHTSAKVSLS